MNAPKRRPEVNFDEVQDYSQRRVDYLDLAANQVVSGYFSDVVASSPGLRVEMFADSHLADSRTGSSRSLVLTFDRLLSDTDFVGDMREILSTLEKAYEYPVDIEFTANFFVEDRYSINLLQCRPLPVRGAEIARLPKPQVAPEDRIIEAHGAVIGHSRLVPVERFIYVVPSEYGQLSQSDRHEVARLIGRINRAGLESETGALVLLGPGRWGTSTPSLGVPVSFADINRVSVLCEIVAMREDLIPDCSLGTHFLNEMVEMDILYLALFPGRGKNYLDTQFFEEAPNRLLDLVPQAGKWQGIVRVVDSADLVGDDESVMLAANALEQEAVCYRTR